MHLPVLFDSGVVLLCFVSQQLRNNLSKRHARSFPSGIVKSNSRSIIVQRSPPCIDLNPNSQDRTKPDNLSLSKYATLLQVESRAGRLNSSVMFRPITNLLCIAYRGPGGISHQVFLDLFYGPTKPQDVGALLSCLCQHATARWCFDDATTT